MSLSTAISNARSGLFVSSKSAEIVANNVANSMTEGYGRQEVRISSRSLGGAGNGAGVDSILRVVNQPAINERRNSEASLAYEEEVAVFYQGLEKVLGGPGEERNLVSKVADLEASLVEAAVSPEDDNRLIKVELALNELVNTINLASSQLKAARESADLEVYRSVQFLNSSLQNVSELNERIVRTVALDGNANGLIDERQRIVDSIGRLVPIKEVLTASGAIRLQTQNGSTLVGTSMAQFTFSRTTPITPDMTITSGGVGDLAISDAESLVGNIDAVIAGGRLEAQLNIRDDLAPLEQDRLDTLANELITRFSDPSLDGSLAGAAGIFTDSGGLVAPGSLVGLASRLEVNSAISPEKGGEIWRLRDGIGAITEGPVGDNALLKSMLNLVEGKTVFGTTSVDESVSSFATDIRASIAQKRLTSQENISFHNASAKIYQEEEMSFGVDTDQELQDLILIENSYAANARLLTVIDEMMQSILRI